MATRTGSRRALALAAVLVCRTAIEAGPTTPPSPEPSSRLAVESDVLRQQIELAAGKAFYLLLDPEARRLSLMYRGVPLREFSVTTMEVGVPRVVFVGRSLPADWRSRLWKGGRLDPLRPERSEEIQPARPGEEPNVIIPPTPEEAYPAPSHYAIRFDGGLTIEVRADAGTRDRGGWLRALREKIAALGWGGDETVRVRLTLSESEAAALYRALPPDLSLLLRR